MKRLIRSFAIYLFALWLITANVGGIDYNNSFQNLALGALALSIAEALLKPLVNLLLLPFNLVTLGIFRWVSSVITLYVATTLAPGFSVVSFTYPGFSSNLFIVPEVHFPLFAAYIVVSFLLSLMTSFLFWLSH
ncbi:MAG: phage holin family protein [Candidatus Blackburnbacteria bacterium]|nr:phage holin family protein [Candidatus Blackburnbacteria bacterium]